MQVPQVIRFLGVLCCLGGLPAPVFADLIRETITEIEFGTMIPITRIKTATGRAQLNGPGVPAPAPMPPAGGRVQVSVPGTAAATASVTLATQRKWHGWIALSASGINGNGTTSDIDERLVAGAPVTVPTRVRIIERERRDPLELIGAYLAPDVTGQLQYNLSLFTTTGISLFDSTTQFSDTSGDVITDSTGELTWVRTPGFFGGLGEPGNLFGVPDQFTTKRWMLTTDFLEFQLPVDLAPGETLDLTIVLQTSSSGSATAGTGAFGIFDYTIPEPETWALLLGGTLALALHNQVVRRRRGSASKR